MFKKLFKLLLLLAVVGGGYAAFQMFWERSYKNEAMVEIQRPPAAIFPLLTNPAHLARWVGGLEESVPLTQGGVRVGARSNELMLIDGKRYKIEREVLALKPNSFLKVATRSAGFQTIMDFELKPAKGLTTVSVVSDTHYTITKGKIFADVINFSAQQKLERDLATLKSLAESR
jgi:uncharacterized protein YndB with AHSA1/START domain